MAASLLDSVVRTARRCGVVKSAGVDVGSVQVELLGDIYDAVEEYWPEAPLRDWARKLAVIEEMNPKNVPPIVKPIADDLAKLDGDAAVLKYLKSIDKRVWKHVARHPNEEGTRAISDVIAKLVIVTNGAQE